jgi:hypothetical protein
MIHLVSEEIGLKDLDLQRGHLSQNLEVLLDIAALTL